ncbi:MAG: lipid IV(A) 4-amino-4-deoxy-L-arabinosyltransferase [Desulfovibrio sp.]|jgi:4-amino-4-deoxy-L-arabinose transferase|nr:lipid IV(A) 4-amino-4-deoxy-L-arabinosyltransferase [Desulfovibrio sp.]
MNGEKLSILVILPVFFALLYLLPLGAAPLRVPDETRYAEISREMATSGDWVVPRLLGKRYFEKPPAGYWINSISLIIFGENNFAARLGPALSTGLGAFMVYALALALRRERRTALSAALIHLSMLQVLGIGTYNVLDAAFSMWVTASMLCSWAALRARTPWGRLCAFALLGSACGMAFLTKGFSGPALAALAVLPVALKEKSLRVLFLHGPVAVLAAVLVALPWGLLIACREADFWNYFFWVEHIKRFAGEKAQHSEPFWFYLPWFAGGMIPWLGLAPGALKKAWQERTARPELFFLLSWVVMPLLFFSAAKGKLPTYILPCAAPLALLLAFYADRTRPNAPGNDTPGHAGPDPLKINGLINLGIGLAGLAAFPVFFFDLTPGPAVYAEGEKFKLWLCSAAFGGWILFSLLSLAEGRRHWRAAALCPLPIILAAAFVLPARITDQKEPEGLIRPHIEELRRCRYVFAGSVGLAAGLAFELKRSDVLLYNDEGELAYGLSYPDGRGGTVSAAAFPAWLEKNRKEGDTALLIRDRDLPPDLGVTPDAVYRKGGLLLLVFKASQQGFNPQPAPAAD